MKKIKLNNAYHIVPAFSIGADVPRATHRPIPEGKFRHNPMFQTLMAQFHDNYHSTNTYTPQQIKAWQNDIINRPLSTALPSWFVNEQLTDATNALNERTRKEEEIAEQLRTTGYYAGDM